MNILVVDDNALVAEATLAALRVAGHTAVWQPSAEKALAIHARGAWDVVIADLGLPGLDGLDLVDRLEQLDPGLPILIVTGHARVGDPRAQARPILLKPVDPDALLAEVARVAAMKKAGP